MSGGLLVNALARETGRNLDAADAERLIEGHGEAFLKYREQVRPLRGPWNCWTSSTAPVCRTPSPPADCAKAPLTRSKCWECATIWW